MRMTGRGCFSEVPPPLSGFGDGLEEFSLIVTCGCGTDGDFLVGSPEMRLTGRGCPQLSCFAGVGGGLEVFLLLVVCGCSTDGDIFVGLSEV